MAGMVRGQARDLGEAAPGSLEALEELHRDKTGALFRAAVEVGALAAGAAPEALAALGRFGDSFGLAFQHADDLADQDHPGFAPAARERVATCVAEAVGALRMFGQGADGLRDVAGQLLSVARPVIAL
jgi:hypothetical protein